MRTTTWILLGSLACSALVACEGGNKTGASASADSAGAASASGSPASATASASAASADSAAAAPSAADSAAASPSADASDSASAAPGAAGAAAPATSAAAKAGKKTYDCGSKGQKACPMQGWMKGVMARAVASGDGAKIASALDTIAAKPVAGYDQWSAVAADGAAKARAGDIDGAKASCKKCHQLYQKKYKQTLRDQPW
jgi:hypothetical protein